ncbi:MAG: short-chain dehydrogenase [Rhizobiales bacterium 24-66-13]|jgi:short-subunit dehydrogenase|nr:MAG: short-chain dehydrogenase [Rhizobiales bacterium 35-66-30]OYZ82920.1 MAG: short-chain dehydrogenase [Rhizobiales bacterium 24-66-13]OZB11906.1 MAG: short-chain dehydrogenase [Rhizobiales bacterium 39-66-18]
MTMKSRSEAPQVVVVTGASAGVGRATARRFARAGASVALIARDASSLEEARAEMEASGARALAIAADVADAEAVLAAAREVEENLGPIDVWVNNAMTTVFAPVRDMTAPEFRRVTEVTYLGYVHGTMAALACMRPRNRGVVVQVGSSLAYRGIPLQAAYCGAKHAIRGFTDSLRAELLHEKSNIALVMVQLPAVNTPQFDWARTRLGHAPRPVPPVIQPEVAAEAIFAGARRPRRELWVGLSTAKVILGSMAVPGFLDHYLAWSGYAAQETGRRVRPGRRDNLETSVRDLHRTRGSFGAEASDSAPVISGQSVRLGIVAFAAGLIALGSCLAAVNGRAGARRRR